jgi:DNA-binding NtrC family response regulator
MATILVLDDDQVVLLQTVLRDAGYDIVVTSGLQAIPPDTKADIVITDLAPLEAYHRESALDWIGSLRTRFGDAPCSW